MEIGLALSGGGIKSVAQIGVIKALEEENIKIDYISGTSAGSIIASLYAMGYNSDEILKMFLKYAKKIKYFEMNKIFNLIFGILFRGKIIIKGLNSGRILEKAMEEAAKNKNIKNISEIKKNLLIPAVNLKNGEIYNFISKEKRIILSDKNIFINNIEISKAVKASCSYPLIFEPCIYKNVELVDGGIRENVPWKELKKMGANKVICVCFEKEVSNKCCKNMVEVIKNSFEILSHELANYEMKGADYIIKIKTKEMGLLDTKKIKILFELGYKKAKSEINKLNKIN